MPRAVKIFFFLSLLSGISLAGFCQPADKELAALLARKDIKAQIRILDSLSLKYRSVAVQQAIAYAMKAVELAEQEEDRELYGAELMTLSKCYRQIGSYDKAIEILRKALKAFIESGSQREAECYNQLGNVYYVKGSREAALESYLTGLALSEKFGLEAVKGSCLNNIGNIYLLMDSLDKALEYYQQAYQLYVARKDSVTATLCLDNIANIYTQRGDFQTALSYQRKVLAMARNFEDKSSYCESLVMIGNTYNGMKMHDTALAYFKESLEISRRIGVKYIIGVSYLNIAEVYKEKGNYDEAILNAREAIRVSLEDGQHNFLKNAYNLLYEVYMARKEPKQALHYLKLYSRLKDSISNQEKARQIEDIAIKYRTEQKDAEIDLLTKDKEKKQVMIYIYTAGTVLLIVLALLVWRSNRQKKKANRLLASQNDIIAQKNQDITDSISYARRIQEAMLPSTSALADAFSDWFIIYKPKDIVSGDFYWCMKKEDQVYVAAADCTGHGVPGALMSMIGMNFYNQIINEGNARETHQVLNELHRKVLFSLNADVSKRDSKDGMDTALVRFDLRTRELQFSGAVRPMYYVVNGELKVVKGERYSIGGVKDIDSSYKSELFRLPPGTPVYLFSDGYADQFGGPDRKKFMVKRLQALLASVHHKSMEEQKQALEQALGEWKGSYEQVDDVLLIGFRVQ
ncbi:MAG: tetratricopeptide repeat protein [Bacteroidota bacterium]